MVFVSVNCEKMMLEIGVYQSDNFKRSSIVSNNNHRSTIPETDVVYDRNFSCSGIALSSICSRLQTLLPC
jgi:hypothetical protein